MSKFVMHSIRFGLLTMGMALSLVIRLDASPCFRAGVIKVPILIIRSYTRQCADIHHPFAAMQCNTLRGSGAYYLSDRYVESDYRDDHPIAIRVIQ
jgi:hypothetical protein